MQTAKSLFVLASLVSSRINAFSSSSSSSSSMATSSSSATTENSSDRLAPWKNRWEENKIGWHETDVHDVWKKYGNRFIPGLNSNSSDAVCEEIGEQQQHQVRVFVPLCGKTMDMAYLAASPAVSQVVGVDGIMKALQEFAKEHPQLELQPASSVPVSTSSSSSITPSGDGGDDNSCAFERLRGNKIELLRGDFFELDEQHTAGRFDVIFDRASIVAIQPALREKYVAVMGKLVQPGGKILLVTIVRCSGDAVQDASSGPPFSVTEEEVRRLYEGNEWVESVTLLDNAGEASRNAGAGMTSLFFCIQAKSL